MEFRTIIKPGQFDHKISYETPVFMTGSCFAEEIGAFFTRGKMDVLFNPFGVLYNPVSVADSLTRIIKKEKFSEDDLYRFNDRFISFHHDTSFSSADPARSVRMINDNLSVAAEKLRKARFLFITFGTARVYRFEKSGKVVSNCHKIPEKKFSREILTVESICEIWEDLIKKIKTFNSELSIVFTVSPVRHWKDGAHGNQVSKSILFVAIEKLISTIDGLSYFPSYELLIDDLRDYRYYKDDMLHPSTKAVEYIWDYFSDSYFTEETKKLYKEIFAVVRATGHRLMGDNPAELKKFSESMLARIDRLCAGNRSIDLKKERDYFRSLVE